MVDWTKPIVFATESEYFVGKACKFVGEAHQNLKVVVNSSNTPFLCHSDGSILGHSREIYRVENEPEPWEEAWKKVDKDRHLCVSEKAYFKEVFNLGRASVEGR